MQVLNRWSTQGATNFDAETRTSHDIAGGTQKVSQTPPSLSGEKGQRVKEGDDCNCCNSTDLSLGFHDHDLSLTRCSTTQNTRVTCYKGCLRLHPFYNDKTIHLCQFFCDARLSPSVGLEIVLMAPLIPKVQAHFTKNGFITCTAG